MSTGSGTVRVLVAAAALVLLLVASGCGGVRDEAGPALELASGVPASASAAEIYVQICQGCHMADGRGAQGGGVYPGFAGNPTLASSAYVAATILHGRRNMPAFARPAGQDFFFAPVWLTDQQVADVVNYLRSEFGNTWADPISADEVRALHP